MQKAGADVAGEDLAGTGTQHEELEAAAVFGEPEAALCEDTDIERKMRGVGLERIERGRCGGSLRRDQPDGQKKDDGAKRCLCNSFHVLDHSMSPVRE